MQSATVHRYYPTTVSVYENSFGWCMATKHCYTQGWIPDNDKPAGELERFESDCTVEVFEFPDGTYAAGWFPGRFRE